MIYILLADGFEESEALVPLDLLRRAGLEAETAAVNSTGSLEVTGSHSIKVTADCHIKDIKNVPAQMVVLPGGMPGAKNLDASADVSALLEIVHHSGGILAAICAAPLVLGKRGYLKGKNAICYPGFEKELEGARIVNDYVVTDGKVITARAMGSAYSFGYALITALVSEEAANAVMKSILA